VGSNDDNESGVALETTREEFVEMADDRPAVIRMEAPLPVDVEPLEAYATLAGETGDGPPSRYAFLLESAEKVASSDPDGAFAPSPGDRHARFSFVGYDPAAVVTVGPEETGAEALDDRYEGLCTVGDGDVLDSVRSAMPDVSLRGFTARERRQLDGGLVGFVTYEAVYDLSLSEVGVDRPESSFPDAEFVLNTKTLAFDHAAETVSLVFTPVVRPDDDPGKVYDSLAREADRVASRLTDVDPVETGGVEITTQTAGSQDAYEAAVKRAREAVYDGEIYQGVISRKRELYGDVDPLGFYESLRETNPSPYMYLLSHGDQSIVGASPETLVSASDDRVVSNPIAGTCPRGNSPVEDRRLAGEMLADEKERAEHTMLVDLARNDVRRVADAGSVRVEEFMNVLKYSHVQHIESTVTGGLAGDRDAFDAVRASFPAGTLSGAPKIRAMEIIRELEADARGPYGGGVGYVSWQGDADFAIVIRSASVEALDQSETETGASQRITVQAGAGIVADSEPAAEYEETEKKMGAVLDALDRIETEAHGDGEAQHDDPAVEQHARTTDSLGTER
jgi:anthranilate synthase component 1